MMRGLGYQSHHFAPGTSGATLNFNFLNDGLDPRITFTRASNATQFNSAGTLVYAPHNLILDSEDWSTASWSRLSCTFSYNAATAPNGTLTADLLIPNNGSILGRATQTISTLQDFVPVTFSVYVKSSGLTNLVLTFTDKAGTVYDSQVLNSATGVLSGSVAAGTTTTAVLDGSNWYRLIFSVNSSASGATTPSIVFRCNNTGDGTNGILLWGAQLNVGSLQSYNQTTSSAYYGPRLDYDPSTLAAQGLLIEEQRTNLMLQSQFVSGWTASAGTLTTNVTASPDGTTNAASFIEDSTNAVRSINQSSQSFTAGATLTASLFVKQTGGATRHFRVQISTNAGANGFRAYFNLATNSVALQTQGFGTGTAVANSATITPVGNGWYRISASGTVDPAATAASGMGFMQDTPSGAATYTGDGTSGLYIWGAQLEAGAFPTSYIPTTTTALTRNADQASVNSLSPWYNASEGTLYAEIFLRQTGDPSSQMMASFNDTTANNRWSFSVLANTNATQALRNTGGAGLIITNTSNTATVGAVNKSALAISTGASLVLNGGTVATNASYAAPTVTRLELGQQLGAARLNGWLRRLSYYPRRLSDAELQAITA